MADIAKIAFDTSKVAARMKVALVCVHIVARLPMSWDRKNRVADRLLDWVMRAEMKVVGG